MMKLQRISKRWVWVAVGLALALAGCGGAGGGGGSASAGSSTTTPVTITVLDGAIQGATVCLDKNANGQCDAAEEPHQTNARGQVTFTVPNAQVGQYPALAIVEAGASDADTGKVSQRYTLQAPKDAVGLVTPLTTLVQSQVEATGASTEVAAAKVQWSLNMRNSPLDDFTTNGDTYAQAIANAVVLASQAQASTIQAAVGQRTASRTLVTQADVDSLVRQQVLSMAYPLGVAAGEKNVASASATAARIAALTPQINGLLAGNGIADPAGALAALQHIKTSKAGTDFEPGTASAWLAFLRFDGPSDVYARYITGSAAENTPQANSVQYRSTRYQRYPNGDVTTWSMAEGPIGGGQLHWTGSAWKNCGINEPFRASVPDAQGNSSYKRCDGVEQGTSQLRTLDVAGQTMLDVYRSTRNQGYTNLRVGDSLASATTLLGSTAFPPGSRLGLQKNLAGASTFSYYPGADNQVYLPDAALAAGNRVACYADPLPAASANTTLAQLVAALRGTPCSYGRWTSNTGLGGATLDSGSRNEYWGSTTLSLGVLGEVPTVQSENQALAFYTGNTRIRVAFGDGGVAHYFGCQESYLGTAYNCSAIGNGGYVIETLGDRRVMHFTGLPQILKGAQNWERVYVEHAGHVYFGFRDLSVPSNSAWLNLPATNALFARLGIGKTVNPGDLLALTASSYEGSYRGSILGSNNGVGITGSFTFQMRAGQPASCSGTSSALVGLANPGGAFTCSNMVLTPASPDSTRATISFGTTSSGESFSGTVDYYTGVVSGIWKGAGTAQGTFTGMRN